MKKIIFLAFLLFFVSGCEKKCDKCEICPSKEEIVATERTKILLENQLIQYGKLVYENDNWLKGGIEPGTYPMNLKELSERNKYDITMFVNPETKEPCNPENTKIEFVVKEKTEGKTKYTFNPVLDCGFE